MTAGNTLMACLGYLTEGFDKRNIVRAKRYDGDRNSAEAFAIELLNHGYYSVKITPLCEMLESVASSQTSSTQANPCTGKAEIIGEEVISIPSKAAADGAGELQKIAEELRTCGEAMNMGPLKDWAMRIDAAIRASKEKP